MNKNLLITLCVGDDYKNMKDLTVPRMKDYCNKYDLDFQIIETKKYTHPAYNKLQIKNYISNYERILFLDIDIIIKKNSPNIFNEVPETKLGILDEEIYQICKCKESTVDLYSKYVNEEITIPIKYYNTGVMLFNRDNIKVLDDDLPYLEELYADQGYINFQINWKNINVHDITFKFNGLNGTSLSKEERLRQSFFIHMNGNGSFQNKYNFLEKELQEVEQYENTINNNLL